MSEETEGQDTGAEAVAGGVDPAAVALALGGASREKADAFLDDQRSLIEIQKHHLQRQFTALDLGILEKRLGVLLRIATAFTGLAIAAGLAFMVWDASQSSGLLIEPFSVPPDLASRGLTGQVLASQMLDKLTAMQNDTFSSRAFKSYANNWDANGIKLDIPKTGVSLTELDDFLREKLGHDVHITGEIVRTVSGVSLTARAGGNGSESVTGSEANMDGLVQKAAEAIYRLTQPTRYGTYLAEHNRLPEAVSIYKFVAENGDKPDRAFAYGMWAVISGEQEGVDTEYRLLQQAMAAEPNNALAQIYLSSVDLYKSHPEHAIREAGKGLSLLASNRLGLFPAPTNLARGLQGIIDGHSGDFHDEAGLETQFVQNARSEPGVPFLLSRLAVGEASEHDLPAARAALLDLANYRLDYQAGLSALNGLRARMLIDSEAQNCADVLSEADAFAPIVQKYPGMRSFWPTTVVPLTAYAEAKLGKIADAEAHISAAPADCYICLITRARIAELQGQHPRADWWFARAIDGQKSIPFAYSYWGQVLTGRGDYDGAIAKFALANQRGPKFADPLEMWGEALMAKNQSHLALAKFAEAEKYAPNWGRLHLKWGEALGYAGKKDEARAQYQKATTLDLTAADKAELARMSHV